jgi:hypothetical protein
MKKEVYFGLGIVALLIYLNYKDKKAKEQKRTSGGGAEFYQPASVMYYGIPLGYGGGDVNQNVSVYQSQSPTSSPIQETIAQSSPAPTMMRGGGRGR